MSDSTFKALDVIGYVLLVLVAFAVGGSLGIGAGLDEARERNLQDARRARCQVRAAVDTLSALRADPWCARVLLPEAPRGD